jgi:hypothetical protein
MTSNIRSAEDMADRFRPEFLNRIDEIVVFEALTREQLGEIVGMQLGRLNERLAERGIALELTDGARELIAEAGWDPAYGARPLKRAIQRLLENPLALALLEGEFSDGDNGARVRRAGRDPLHPRRGGTRQRGRGGGGSRAVEPTGRVGRRNQAGPHPGPNGGRLDETDARSRYVARRDARGGDGRARRGR